MTDHQFDTTHAPVCWGWGPKHYECALREIEALRAEVHALQKTLTAIIEGDCQMTTKIELLPLPEGEASSFGDYQVHDNEAMMEYARANVVLNTALLQAEIKALLAEVERLRAENERLQAEVGRFRTDGVNVDTTHATGCWGWGPKHYECAVREIETLRAEVYALREALKEAKAALSKELNSGIDNGVR